MSLNSSYQSAFHSATLKNPAYSLPYVEEKEHILIVDDSPTIRKLFAKYLASRFVCVEAASYSEALEQLSKSEFVLVLADQIMPGLSGTELLRKIVEKYPDTAVIMVSGINQPQGTVDAIRLGAFDYLIKPCELGVLKLTIERALKRRSLMIKTRQYKQGLSARNQELVQSKE